MKIVLFFLNLLILSANIYSVESSTFLYQTEQFQTSSLREWLSKSPYDYAGEYEGELGDANCRFIFYVFQIDGVKNKIRSSGVSVSTTAGNLPNIQICENREIKKNILDSVNIPAQFYIFHHPAGGVIKGVLINGLFYKKIE